MKQKQIITAAVSALLAVAMLSGCAGGGGGTGEQVSNPFSPAGGTNPPGVSQQPVPATGVDAQLKITPGEWSNIQWTNFTHMYATAEIPQGWTAEVTDLYQGGQTGSGTMITVKNPAGDVEISYMDFATYYAGMVKENTVEAFFRDAIAPNAQGVSDWKATGSIQTEAQRMFMSSQSNIADARVVQAEYNFNGKPMEGVFSGAIDTTLATSGMYTVVSVISMGTPKGTLANWENVLVHILSSIQWTDACKQRYQTSVLSSSGGSSSNGSDTIMEAWNNRNKSEEIMSQKRSDATLGYERVYDTTTNEIYLANSGFTQQYTSMGGQRYQPITDEMYTQGYTGSIGF